MALPDGLREFDDAESTRKFLYDNTLEAVKHRFPIEDENYRLELDNVRYDGPQKFSLAQQKRALITGRQLRTNIKGTWALKNSAGDVLATRDDTVLQVPYYTDRGTIIFNGNEYSVLNQARLRPGVYTRKTNSGELEAQFNIKKGTGRGFRILMDPETGVFKTKIGQAHIPLLPLLQALGVDDNRIEQAWGPQVFQYNRKKTSSDAVKRYYESLAGRQAQPDIDDGLRAQWLRDSLPGFGVDPDVVARTSGLQNVKGVTPELLLRSTSKLLGINRGDEEPDDRDNLEFASIHSIEDLIPERIKLDAGFAAKRLFSIAKRDQSLDRIRAGALNPYISDPKSGFLLGSRLAQPLEETSPISTLEQMSRITRLGQGGIGSPEAVTMASRLVNPSQLGFIDYVAGPESEAAGIDTRAAYRTFKGKDNRLYGEFKTPDNRNVYLTPGQTYDKIVAFPGEMESQGDYVQTMHNGKLGTHLKPEVELVVPSLAHMQGSNLNMELMPTAVQAERLFYGGKFWSQYLPQVEGETPLVDSLTPDGKQTFSEYYGRKAGSLSAKTTGTVTRVTDDAITVTDNDGNTEVIETVTDLPFNRLTSLSFKPVVKPGDQVVPGQLVANSNFTDPKTGGFNMGRNLKTAVLAARGDSFEDGYVISESAAKKLATQRLEGFDRDTKSGVEISRRKYVSMFKDKFDKKQLDKLDDNGVVKQGETLESGDPIILAVGPKLLSPGDAQLGKLHKVLRNTLTDKAVLWEHDYEGRVTDSYTGPSGARVNIASNPPVNIADKLSTRFGLKGVTSKIIPDDEMPRDPGTDEPYELLLNFAAIPTRVAPGQIMELALGKLAKATGKPVRIPQAPPPEGWLNYTRNQLKAAGVPETSPVFDPQSGKTLKDIGTGYVYVSAFHHLADKKLSARGESGGYTMDRQPAKGGSTGGKRVSGMDIQAMIAHGARDVLRDSLAVRGTMDDEYWRGLRAGRALPEPKTPFIYDKFLNTLRAGGVNVTQKGDLVSVMPQTDADVLAMAPAEINPRDPGSFIDSDFNPVKGGLFDPGKTGGMEGRKWTYYSLPEPLPNPIMEEPIRRVLGLTTKAMESVLTGETKLNGKTGGQALRSALSAIDIDARIEELKDQAKNTRGQSRDSAVKALGFLSAARKQGINPGDWMVTKVPVLPPVFRPVARAGDMALSADTNELYRDLMVSADNYKKLSQELEPEELKSDRLGVYKALTAVYGLGDPITPEGRAKNVKGAIRQIIGDSPKHGMFQSKVISKPVGIVGRGVITGDKSLDMDTVGIPEDSAWQLYRDFIIRGLVRRGYAGDRAISSVDNRTETAKQILEYEMSNRPVIIDRAPTWHKFNLLAFNPKIVDGSTIRVSPLIVKGFNADFDGDQMNFHVPVMDSAVRQAKSKMMPTQNLTALTDLRSVIHAPTNEFVAGLYVLTRPAKPGVPRKFDSLKALKLAYKRGEIQADDPVVIP